MTNDPRDRSRAHAAAGVLFFDGQSRVMLVEPTYKSQWEIPGGYVEAGETPVQAAAREIREELGIDVRVGRLLAVDWAPLSGEGDKLLFVFDGGTLTATQLNGIRLPPDELASYDFHPVSDAIDLLPLRLSRRLIAAVNARHAGETVYLEHGIPHPN